MDGAVIALRPPRRNGSLALHAQISDQIRVAIGSGTLHPGDQLPPEAELAQQAHVARLTVRQALDNLAREGVIERRHGIGTFVANTAARTGELARATIEHSGEVGLLAANVKAEAQQLRQEAKRLRAEMAALRTELARLLSDRRGLAFRPLLGTGDAAPPPVRTRRAKMLRRPVRHAAESGWRPARRRRGS